MEFSEFHGENILLADDRKSAQWNITYSGGLIFSENDFQRNDVMNVLLCGSGHVDVGYVFIDPDVVVDLRKVNKEKTVLKEIRVHKLETEIKLFREDDNISLSISKGESGIHRLSTNQKLWVVIYIKFGDVKVTIAGDQRSRHNCGRIKRFHYKCGTNVELTAERTSASLFDQNPASVCCLSRKIYMGETINIKIKALPLNNKTPSRFHLVLGWSELDPKDFENSDPDSFRLTDPTSCEVAAWAPNRDTHHRSTRRWKVIRKFDKLKCEGDLKIYLAANCKLKYFHSMGEKVEEYVDTTYDNGGILIVLGLWRTSVEIIEHEPDFFSTTTDDTTSTLYEDVYIQSNSYLETTLPAVDIASLTINSGSSMPLDVPDARASPPDDWWGIEETSVKQPYVESNSAPGQIFAETNAEQGYEDPKMERDMGQRCNETILKESEHETFEKERLSTSITGADSGEYTQLIKKHKQNICSTGTSKKMDKENVDGMTVMAQNTCCSNENEVIVLKSAVQKHFTYLVENLTLNDFCDHLYEGKYLTRLEMESIITKNCVEPVKTRKEFLIKILSTRPISKAVLRRACRRSKQVHIFEKLV